MTTMYETSRTADTTARYATADDVRWTAPVWDGARLTKLREAAGLSRRQLAEIVDVPAALVAVHEDTNSADNARSADEPRVSDAARYATALRVTLAELLLDTRFEAARLDALHEQPDRDDHEEAAAEAVTGCRLDGDRIRAGREALGLSLEDAATRGRLHPRAWEMAESGELPGSTEELLRILGVLHAEPGGAVAALPGYLSPVTPRTAEDVRAARAALLTRTSRACEVPDGAGVGSAA